MPYKHIAAHLKKTELACRLHYHQLSHGSNRRKQRTTSVSSGSSANHSPVMRPTMPSPIRETTPRSVSPPGSSGGFAPVSPGPMQLPSIMGHGASPRLPAILPKPVCMTLPTRTSSPSRGYPTPLPEPHSAPLPPASFRSTSSSLPMTPPLRLECMLPQPQQPPVSHQHVDMNRLNSVYTAHRASFWAAVANDYGPGANPVVLESAWKNGSCCNQTSTPITPTSSPDNTDRDTYPKPQDKTRISAILGIDANPRSPRERELVRRMEEERV